MISSPRPTLPPSLLVLPTFSAASNLRLQSLYSDFSRQKHSNPTSFYANVEWWRQALEGFVANGLQRQSTSKLVLNAGYSLVDSLRVEAAGKPIALGAVITELCSSSPNTIPSFIPLSAFISTQTSIYRQASIPYLVASYLVGKPLWWALEQLGIAGEDGLLSSTSSSKQSAISWHEDYVLLNLVQDAAERIITQQQSVTAPADCLYTFDGFRTAFASCIGGPMMAEIDAKVLLKYLERDKGVIVVTKDIIKFVEKDAPADARKITAVDVGILELKMAIQKLHSQIEGIQNRIDQCTEKASTAVKQSHKDMAMSHLRVRKQLQALLPKRLASLDNLEGTLISVEAAAGDIEILSAFQSSTTTLRTILSHPSLQRDSIEWTMEAMAEANADAKQVDEVIKISGDIAVGIDDTDFDVEDELQGLVEQAERETALFKEKEMQDKLERLPATPTLPEEQRKEMARVPIST